jgi:serine/threonine protein kinase
MTQCLDHDQMEQLLADVLPAEQQAEWDEHLSDCPACREKLESLTDVAGISRVMGTLTANKHESKHLKLAMDRLHQEGTYFRSEHSTFHAQASSVATLPLLQPAQKDGFIGRLGDIQIRRVLGQGGMGVVFEGLDAVLNRTVAVKVLSPHLLNHPEAKERFVREAQAAAALLHENVVAIHGIHEAEGMPYLVLQYVQGESLSERLQREKKLPLDAVIKLGKQVARGLAAAHDRGLVHRDIKPGNILFDAETGDVRIADFGLAKHMGTETMTKEGVLTGTPAYMSPEQTSDQSLDGRSDLFSLGVVLYQASSGKLPFVADSPFVLLDQIRSTEEKPLKELNPELPDWFCELVHRLLKKDAENRISSAMEVVRVLEQQSVSPANAASQRPTWLPIVLTMLLVGGGLAALWLAKDRTDPLPTQGVLTQATGFSINGSKTLIGTLAEAVEAAPDNAIIEVQGDGPFSTGSIKIENKKLTIRSAVGSHPRIIPEVMGSASYHQFLTTSADLRLEGLEIYWPVSPPTLKSDEPLARAVITIHQGTLTVLNCRIVSGPGIACIASEGQPITVERSHLISPNGSCIGWRVGSVPTRIDNCMLESRFIFNIARPAQVDDSVRNAFIVTNCNIKCYRMINYLLDARSKAVLDCQFERNIVDGTYLFTLVNFARTLIPLGTHEAMLEALKGSVTWKESRNTYRKRIIYLGSSRFNNMANITSSEFKQLSSWLTHWIQSESQSQEGTVTFQENAGASAGKLQLLQLNRSESPEVPADVGVVSKTVGPGEGYAAWRKEAK